MKKMIKKGFTLVELIIVMAVFSLLLVGVMALIGPVSRMFANTSMAEKTYSYANNIQVYLQGKLEYAEDIYVATSDMINPTGVTDIDRIALAEQFRKDHFENTVVKRVNASVTEPLRGKIHIYRLLNKDDSHKGFKAGEIVHSVYQFDSVSTISGAMLIDGHDEVSELNPAFFEARDAAYNFSYALGSTDLVVVDTPTGGEPKEVYRALKNDFNNSLANIGSSTLAVSIVIDKKSGGSIDESSGGHVYRAFRNPVALQIANLPLTNINFRCKNQSDTHGMIRPYWPDLTDKTKIDYQKTAIVTGVGSPGIGYDDSKANKNIDFNNDIYFVCCYSDELG